MPSIARHQGHDGQTTARAHLPRVRKARVRQETGPWASPSAPEQLVQAAGRMTGRGRLQQEDGRGPGKGFGRHPARPGRSRGQLSPKFRLREARRTAAVWTRLRRSQAGTGGWDRRRPTPRLKPRSGREASARQSLQTHRTKTRLVRGSSEAETGSEAAPVSGPPSTTLPHCGSAPRAP